MSLSRHVPLIRRTPLRTKPQRDPLSASLHDYILRRDRECVAAKLGFEHVCRDRYGAPHAPFALPLLTVEHVKDELAMGQRAPSKKHHLVALCAFLNNRPPSREMREAFRLYLANVEPVPHG